MSRKRILLEVDRYYSGKLKTFGPTARGVDWNSAESQRLRFAQLMKLNDQDGPFSINDYGCGYGALADYLRDRGMNFSYCGFDVSEAMIAQAQSLHADSPACRFLTTESDLTVADYTVASGVFNVKLDFGEREWQDFMLDAIDKLARLSTRGFAFNALTSYSDPGLRRPDLYYADPRFLFDVCRRRYSKWVALLHDYGLYEFTVLVRRREERSWLS